MRGRGLSLRPCHRDYSDLAGTAIETLGGETLHHYIICRRDLPLGLLGANIAHAAGESSPGNLPEGTHAYILMTPDEAGLLVLEKRLKLAGLRFKAIREPDAPWNNALMAIGIEPGRKEELRRHLSHLPLLK